MTARLDDSGLQELAVDFAARYRSYVDTEVVSRLLDQLSILLHDRQELAAASLLSRLSTELMDKQS
uniref:hypothetical protein n=1 Tax=Amycolatopsis sp. CA-290885 TaxID=3239925 RepID=UPI003F494C48